MGRSSGRTGGGIDHHSLANRRDEAYRSGDLERTAELSREPNVHLGPQMFAELPGEQDSLDPRRGPSSGSARVSRGRLLVDRRQILPVVVSLLRLPRLPLHGGHLTKRKQSYVKAD